MYTCIYVGLYIRVGVYIYIHICTFDSIYTYTYIHHVYTSLNESTRTAGAGLQHWMHALPKGRLHAKGRPADVHSVEEGSHQTPGHTEPGKDQIPGMKKTSISGGKEASCSRPHQATPFGVKSNLSNRGFLKSGYLQIIHLNGIFHYKL